MSGKREKGKGKRVKGVREKRNECAKKVCEVPRGV